MKHMESQEHEVVVGKPLGPNGMRLEPRPTSDFSWVQGKRINRGMRATQRKSNRL